MGEHGPGLAVDRLAVVSEAIRVREVGERVSTDATELVSALEEASAAASGVAGAVPGGLISGPALAECAALLARRARDCAAETDRIAEDMTRAVGLLVEADEEVARGVADAAG